MKKFILLVKYKKPLEEVDKYLKDHILFLDKYYASNNFLVSGRRNPRTGGVIICQFNSIDEVNNIIKEDPFFIQNIADYEVVEFEPTRGISI